MIEEELGKDMVVVVEAVEAAKTGLDVPMWDHPRTCTIAAITFTGLSRRRRLFMSCRNYLICQPMKSFK